MSSFALATATATATPRRLHRALWTVQALLALAFGLGGLMKLMQPIDVIGASMPWALSVPAWVVRFNAAAELAGALGLLLPSITRIKPRLTVLAAIGLTTVMVLAIGLHLSRGEQAAIAAPVVLGALAAFVAWGRATAATIAPRGH